MHVPLETLRRAVVLVDSLAGLDDPADFAPVAMPGLMGLIGCDVITYNEIGPGERQVRYLDYPSGLLDPALTGVFSAHVDEHPVVRHYQATGSPDPVKISDFLSQRQFHALGLYADFFRAVSVEHQLAVGLPGPPGLVTGFAFNRGHGDFTETDRALLGFLQVPLTAALERARARHGARETLERAGDAGLAALTGRQTQILQLVAGGHTNAAIARKLEVSPRTVAKHLEHLYRKLGVTSRAAAAACAAPYP